jgi:hypothetical protein
MSVPHGVVAETVFIGLALTGLDFVGTLMLEEEQASEYWCEVYVDALPVNVYVCRKWSYLDTDAACRRVLTCTRVRAIKQYWQVRV